MIAARRRSRCAARADHRGRGAARPGAPGPRRPRRRARPGAASTPRRGGRQGWSRRRGRARPSWRPDGAPTARLRPRRRRGRRIGEQHEETLAGQGTRPGGPRAASSSVPLLRPDRSGRPLRTGGRAADLARPADGVADARGRGSGAATVSSATARRDEPPGPGGGTCPGRAAVERAVGSGVVSGESGTRTARPACRSPRGAGRGVVGGAGEHVGAVGRPAGVGRDEEVHRRRRHREVLAAAACRSRGSLQQLRAPSRADVRDLPRGVLRVGHPGVEAPRPERRHEVRRVARQQHPPHPHPGRDPGVEPVHRHPHDLVGAVADDRPDAPVEGTRRASASRS